MGYFKGFKFGRARNRNPFGSATGRATAEIVSSVKRPFVSVFGGVRDWYRYAKRKQVDTRKFSKFFSTDRRLFGALGILVLFLAVPVLYWNLAFKDTDRMNAVLVEAEKRMIEIMQRRELIIKQRHEKSIATFFLSDPVYGSVAVYQGWEGKYRMEEKGSKVDFRYIGSKNGENPVLFSISRVTEKEWNGVKKDPVKSPRELARRNGNVYIASLIDPESVRGSGDHKLVEMAGEAPELIRTFRAYGK